MNISGCPAANNKKSGKKWKNLSKKSGKKWKKVEKYEKSGKKRQCQNFFKLKKTKFLYDQHLGDKE